MMGGWIVGIYLAPFGLWLASIIFAVLTLTPEMHKININSTASSKKDLKI